MKVESCRMLSNQLAEKAETIRKEREEREATQEEVNE